MNKELSKKTLIVTIVTSIIVIGICVTLIIINSNKLSDEANRNIKSAESQTQKWEDLGERYLGD